MATGLLLSLIFAHARSPPRQVAARHRLSDVLDHLLSSLCKFTLLLNPSSPKPAVAFGEDVKVKTGEAVGSPFAGGMTTCGRLWRGSLARAAQQPPFLSSVPPSLPLFFENAPIQARMAAVTAFSIASKFGDSLRGGAWRALLDVVLRLHKLGLLPPGEST